MKWFLRIIGGLVAFVVMALIAVVIHANVSIGHSETVAADANAPGRFITIDGRRWHVLVKNDANADAAGVPILLIHGFAPIGQVMWEPWSQQLAKHRTLIMPDTLGYGHSQHDTTPGDYYTTGSYADSLAAILDQLGVAQADVIGHSYGGAIAARLALDHPERVRRLIFMNAAVYYERNATDNLIQWPLGIGRALAWHAVGGGPKSIMTRICVHRADRHCLELLRVKDTTDTLRAMMYTYHHSPDAAVVAADLPKLTMRPLVIWGAGDPFFPAPLGERLARETGAQLKLIQGAYHAPYLERPEEVTRIVLDFFSS